MNATPAALRSPARAGPRRSAGFTLVELVVVMVLMAVLTAVGASRFAGREPFAVQATADQLASGLRLAQAMAVAQRQPVYVVLGTAPASLAVCLDAACTQPLPPPGGDTNTAWLSDTDGLGLAPATSFQFLASGEPSLAAGLQVQVSAAGSAAAVQSVQVEAVSGHVHSP